ncbi:MAG: PEGA domain-containing protein [Candidatus Eisenbacteria bacterium]|nr:PEGA domain-containing protein [Candidatus Latescibacterota bacterium]MBD3301358.1 PEGA domain-containing protein [Candidatus Eisenbacteria bacterium]
MSCSRTSRLVAHGIAPILLIAAILLAGGCEDDLRDPTMAEVEIHFRSDSPTLRQGAEVWLDGTVLTRSLAVATIDTLLAEGTHTFVVRKDCIEVMPAETLEVEIEGGRPATIEFDMSLRCGLLALRVHSDVPGLALGSRIWVDGALEVDSLTVEEIELLLEPGAHVVEIEKECAAVTPADSFVVEIEEAQTREVDLDVSSAGVLSVTSEPSGLPVSLDGEMTGVETPAAFPCIDPGTYEVAVHPRDEVGFLVVGDTLQTVTVTESGETEVDFVTALIPLTQSRGVLVELFTATLCPNCAPAEHVLDDLEHDGLAYEPSALSTAELHLTWGGSDPFYNNDIGQRVTYYYGNDSETAPIAYFNGGNRIHGSNLPDLDAAYRGRIEEAGYGEDAEAGLYWRDVRIEENVLRGDLRFVAIQDLSGYESPHLFAFYTKDSLYARQFPNNWVHFFAVVREYYGDAPLDLEELQLTEEGTFTDLEVEFDLGLDAEWETPSIRLCAFVQDLASREVLQVREVRLRLPPP